MPAGATSHLDKEGRVFTVRPLLPNDREALEAFYAEFEPKRAAQGLPPEGAPRVKRWLDAVLPTGTHLAVEHEGRLVGHSMLIPTERPHVSEYAIFLHQDVRGRGLGTEINRRSVEIARTMEVTRLWLSVEPQNRPAVRSYEKAGFRFRPGTIYSPEVEMEMDLHETAA
ncbi:MAG TPA: GNAT family N-acetyltransferase [Longimicrobiaceae bacterium]|nr:GNAT family N-acetyltransferase [Longimicrobiaceae bacterium]